MNVLPMQIRQPLSAFVGQVDSVRELLVFDQFVLEHVVGGLSGIVDELERRNQNNAATTVKNRLDAVANIRKAGSLRPRYETIFNQCVVLLVSYFGSTVGDLFRLAIDKSLSSGVDVPVANEIVEIDWRTLSQDTTGHSSLVARLVVGKQKITFQDMGGIVRAFDKNLGIQLQRNEAMNDIILGQAARHAIVHAGATIDGHMRNQVRSAVPRTLKGTLVEGQPLSFTPEEVNVLANQMIAFVTDATEQVAGVLPPLG